MVPIKYQTGGCDENVEDHHDSDRGRGWTRCRPYLRQLDRRPAGRRDLLRPLGLHDPQGLVSPLPLCRGQREKAVKKPLLHTYLLPP